MKYLFIVLTTLTLSLNAQIITTVAGNGNSCTTTSVNGVQASSIAIQPIGVTLDNYGNLYIVDECFNDIRIVNNIGIITTVAGNGTSGFSGDGGQATNAQLKVPYDAKFDVYGNLYIADNFNYRIRLVNTLGIITTIAGDGIPGYIGDGGQATATELQNPNGIAFDSFGNLYIADASENRVRKVNTAGIITTICGNGTIGYSGDGGQATAAELNAPVGIAFDIYGNLYISDNTNNRIRMVNSSGIINTVVGNGTCGYNGDGGLASSAKICSPWGIIFDALNNLYFTDRGNNRIRKVNTFGIISTIVGNGTNGYAGDGGLATMAEINDPVALTLSTTGDLYFTDTDNFRVRKVTNVITEGINQVANINEQVTVYPNPATTSVQVLLAANTENATLVIRDMLGNAVYHATTTTTNNTIPIAEFASGVYIIEVSNSKGAAFKKFIKE